MGAVRVCARHALEADPDLERRPSAGRGTRADGRTALGPDRSGGAARREGAGAVRRDLERRDEGVRIWLCCLWAYDEDGEYDDEADVEGEKEKK